MRRPRPLRALVPAAALASLLAVLLLCAPDPALATAGDAALCDRAAARAASETGVPLQVLLAITRTETARHGAPWPWTVNMEGTGRWFDSRAEAETYASAAHIAGARSFDIGCFQINHRWHGQHFASIPAMFEPLDNARYAARFLAGLHAELGDWEAAVGAYHSRTEAHASRYLRVWRRHLAALDGAPEPPPAAEAEAPRVNTFPLLQAGAPARLGSLVPGGSGARPLFGAAP